MDEVCQSVQESTEVCRSEAKNPRYQKPQNTQRKKAPNGGRLGNRAKKQEVEGKQELISRKGVGGGGVDNEPQVQHIRAETGNHSSGNLGQTWGRERRRGNGSQRKQEVQKYESATFLPNAISY